MRTSFGGAGALNVTPKVTPSGKSLCGSSDWTTIACWACACERGAATASVAMASASATIKNLRNRGSHLCLEVRADHVVEIAFEHAGSVACLVAGAVILHHLVWMKHVAADLVAPAGAHMLALDLRLLLRMPRQFALDQSRFEHAHRRLAVAVLRALVLARYDDARGNVGDTDSGRVLLDVLAAVPARAVDVDAKVVGVDLHFGRVGRLGQHFDEGERRMARVSGVERREPDETMDAAFAPQIAEGVRARDFDCGALDAGLFAGHQVDDVRSEAALLAPAQVHAHEHLRPVLRFSATGAGVDGDDRIAVVIWPGERELELQIVQLALDVGSVPLDVGGRGFVLFGLGEVKQL